MGIQFTAENHKYTSLDPNENIDWLSATGFIKLFKTPFDQKGIAEKSSKNKRSKWYGMSVEDIISVWEAETKRAVTVGSWYHDQREEELVMCDNIQREGLELPIIKPIEKEGVKIAPHQGLTPGIYPEHMVYLKSARLCGQADRVEVISDRIDLFDYKTNKEIKLTSYVNWEGKSKRMLGPCSHLDDCNFNHYALQLSLYMYIMLKRNHNLKPGKMQIHHVIFEKESENEYGYPIVKRDLEGNPVVKEVIPYDIPYLKKEIQNMIKYLKTHPEIIKKGHV